MTYYNQNREKKNLFSHQNKREGGIFEFSYSYSNDNLVKGETFEREVLERFKNLTMFSICFPCTPYLLNDGKLLFLNGDYQSWAIRVGKMNNPDGPGPENMEEDYEYINSAPNYSEPFEVASIGRYKLVGDGGCDMFVFLSFDRKEGGFLIPVQCKFRSNENMQRYDPNIKYEGGNKTLNHYLTDFDSLLDRMIFDKTEVNFNIRYGIYIVSSNVHIPERFPRTRNVIMVIHDFEINIENIRMFFNRIRSRNHNANLKNTESRMSIASAFETSINSTDREILIAQTDILDRELRKCATNVYWARNQDNLMRMVRDTIIEIRTCLKDTQSDRQTARYARELRERQQKYLSVNQFGVTKKEIIESEEIIQNDTFDMNSLSEALDQTEAPEEQFDIYKIIASLNKKK